MSFLDQTHPNGLFVSTLRPPQQKLVIRPTKSTVRLHRNRDNVGTFVLPIGYGHDRIGSVRLTPQGTRLDRQPLAGQKKSDNR